MLSILLAVGLGIDISRFYLVKTELQNGADAAALAAVSALNGAPKGIDDAERRLGDPGAANLAYRKGLALTSAHLETNPNSYLVRAHMANIQARLGQMDNARSGIAQAMQSPDKDKLILLCAILTYEAMGDREQALKMVGQISPQMKITVEHHPDLADLRKDLRLYK